MAYFNKTPGNPKTEADRLPPANGAAGVGRTHSISRPSRQCIFAYSAQNGRRAQAGGSEGGAVSLVHQNHQAEQGRVSRSVGGGEWVRNKAALPENITQKGAESA